MIESGKTYGRKFRADEPNFIDMTRVESLATTDVVIKEQPAPGTAVKGVFIVKRRVGLTLGNFRKQWREVHAPAVLKVPGRARLSAMPHSRRRLYMGRAAMGRGRAAVVRRRRRGGAGFGISGDEGRGRRRPGRFSHVILRAREPDLVVSKQQRAEKTPRAGCNHRSRLTLRQPSPSNQLSDFDRETRLDVEFFRIGKSKVSEHIPTADFIIKPAHSD